MWGWNSAWPTRVPLSCSCSSLVLCPQTHKLAGLAQKVPELCQNLLMNLLGAGEGGEARDGTRAASVGRFTRKPETRWDSQTLSSGCRHAGNSHLKTELELTNLLTSLTCLLTSSKSQLDLLLNTALWPKSSVSFCRWTGSKSHS